MAIKRYLAVLVSVFCVSGLATADNRDDWFTGVYGGVGIGVAESDTAVPVFLGGRRQLDNGLVLGVEGQGILISGDAEDDGLNFFDGAASVLAKVGYTTNGRFMVYGGAGYGNVDTNGIGSEDGFAVEGGIEYMATSWAGVRLSANHVNAGNGNNITGGYASLILSF